MIKILLGLVGSGKTAQVVREIALSSHDRPVFTNIRTHGIKNVHYIKPEYIIKKTITYSKTGKESVKYDFHKEFWVKTLEKHKAINVVIDEAHNYFNPRRSMSKLNIIMANFLSMLRRILGSTDNSNGELILITQLDRRLDVIAREMATNITYSRCHYFKDCVRCGFRCAENNEVPEPLLQCPVCSHKLKKSTFQIEVHSFINIQNYELWRMYKTKTFYKRHFINDIEKYFKHYNTLQYDELFEMIE